MSNFRYFTLDEFACKETGQNLIDEEFVGWLDVLREACGFAFVINSGYRSPQHSAEANKPGGPGPHTRGRAADIRVENSRARFVLVRKAVEAGCTRIGIGKNYVHLDLDEEGAPHTLWHYY